MKKITLNKSRKKSRINLDGSFVSMIKPVKLRIATANYLRLQKTIFRKNIRSRSAHKRLKPRFILSYYYAGKKQKPFIKIE